MAARALPLFDQALCSAFFSRAAACRLAGLARRDLERWEDAINVETGRWLGASLTFPEVFALAVLNAASLRLDARAADFSVGLGRLFVALCERSDVERLDDHTVIVGRDFARLVELRSDHIRCEHDDFIVVALRPILAHLRNQVFS